MNKTYLCITALVLVLGLCVGYYLGGVSGSDHKHRNTDKRMSSYLNGKLTNQLLECIEPEEGLTIGERASIERNVSAYLDTSIKQGIVTEAAIYFRDLNNGPWFGINERVPFTPGSLLKLPLAMTLYRTRVKKFDATYFDQKIEYTGRVQSPAEEAEFGSDAQLPTGVYSVRDLVSRMLKDSSNDAAEVLVEFIGVDALQEIYTDFGIEKPEPGKDYLIDVKLYGAFFRVLFNASYAGANGSEEILSMLTQASFRDGLVAGVPSDVKVAHKFGTRVVGTGPGSRQLHDCGIVYAPKAPYVLCIMTRGNETKNLEYFIAQVSKRVYDGVTN